MAAPSPSSSAIIDTLTDFTSVENWDQFFTLRGSGDSFEWYAEWPDLQSPLLSLLSPSPPPEILVPGCGSSVLSEKLYDAGYENITNVDFSKVVIADMLRRHARSRPRMRWRVMDITEMQFSDGLFDVIIDKGGLDALMEPEVGTKLGSKYLNEVKRTLKVGGKFICFTLAESHVTDLLLPEFRFGWELSIQAIPYRSSRAPTFQTFMVAAVKGLPGIVNQIKFSNDSSPVFSNARQGNALANAIKNENSMRVAYSQNSDALYSLQDLNLGAKGDLKEIIPGRRIQFILGKEDISTYCYRTVLLDAKEPPESFHYLCGIFIVPKIRSNEWLFNSEEGQWLVVENAKAARLIMVFLDASHTLSTIDYIQKDLSPLVKDFAPGKGSEVPIPYMMASDGVKQKINVEEIASQITGPMIVEDVVYESAAGHDSASSETKTFRRLIFQRSVGLVQSEALLIADTSNNPFVVNGKSKKLLLASRKKKGKGGHADGKGSKRMLVDHSFLGSSYHSGIITGFALVATQLANAVASGRKVKTFIIGLGAGLFPMFLRGCFPSLDIEVIELDPVVTDLAKKHFGFVEDDQLKVRIGDGVQFVKELASRCTRNEQMSKVVSEDGQKQGHPGSGSENGIKILIIDADSSDLSSGLTCPPANFVEESFLSEVKNFLSDGGLFVINLVSRSPTIRKKVLSTLEAVFGCLYSLQLDEDVNEVLFASSSTIDIADFEDAVATLKTVMRYDVAVDVNSKKMHRLK